MNVKALLNRKYVSWREVHRSRRAAGFSSFSQFGEDAVVASLVPQQAGVYLDVGAGHPVTFSNTYSFYRQGWSGVLVEPLPANAEHARRVRPRDLVVEALCGSQTYDEIEFSNTAPMNTQPQNRNALLSSPRMVISRLPDTAYPC